MPSFLNGLLSRKTYLFTHICMASSFWITMTQESDYFIWSLLCETFVNNEKYFVLNSMFHLQRLKSIFRQCRTSCRAVATSCRSLAIHTGLLYKVYYWNLKTCRSLWLADNESCRSHMKFCRTVTDDRRLFHTLSWKV